MRCAEINIGVENPAIVLAALAPETKGSLARTKVNLLATSEGIDLRIDAEDISALRAALNSYLRWIDLAIKINENV